MAKFMVVCQNGSKTYFNETNGSFFNPPIARAKRFRDKVQGKLYFENTQPKYIGQNGKELNTRWVLLRGHNHV